MAVEPNTRWTEDTRIAFLLALKQQGRVIDAAAAIGRTASTAYAHKRRHPDFAARWDAIVAEVQAAWIAERGAAPPAERIGRERRDGWTADKRARFLALLSSGETVRAAAAVDLHESATHALRRRSPGFAAAWDQALVSRAMSPLEAAYARAVEGWDEPVVFQGQVAAHKRRYSDAALRLLIAREDKRLAKTAADMAEAVAQSRNGRMYAAPEETDRALLAKLADLERKRKVAKQMEAEEFADRMRERGWAP